MHTHSLSTLCSRAPNITHLTQGFPFEFKTMIFYMKRLIDIWLNLYSCKDIILDHDKNFFGPLISIKVNKALQGLLLQVKAFLVY